MPLDELQNSCFGKAGCFLHKSNPAITAFIFVLEFHLTNNACSVISTLFRSRSQEDQIKDTPSKRGDYSFSAGRTRCLSEDFWLAVHLLWGKITHQQGSAAVITSFTGHQRSAGSYQKINIRAGLYHDSWIKEFLSKNVPWKNNSHLYYWFNSWFPLPNIQQQKHSPLYCSKPAWLFFSMKL